MEELCQPTLNGRGGPIAPIAIQATNFGVKNDINFGLKNDMIQQVQNSCQFHGLPSDDANKHLDKLLHVTQSIKVNGVTDDALRLYLFPYSLTHHATVWFDRLPRNSITTFEQMAKMFLGKYFPPYMDTFAQRSESSCSITSSFDPKIITLKAKMAEINRNLMKVLQINQQVKAVTLSCEICDGPHSYNDCPTTVGQTQNVYAAGAYNQGGFNQNQNRSNLNQNYQNRNQGNNHGNPQGNNQGRNQFFQGASHVQNPPLAYQAPAYQALGYQAPVQQASIPQPQVVTTIEFTNYMKANDAILKNMQTNMTSLTNSNLELKNMFGQFMKMNTASSLGSGTLPSNTIINSKEDLKGITTRSAKTPLNQHCSAVLLKKLPEKLGDPGKFLIPCDFSRMDECLALANLGASINLMPLFVWNKLFLPGLSPTCMTLELADRSISRSVGVAEDVSIKVGKFHFSTDFVVVDFNTDPRVPLILRRSFLKTGQALIDVYEGELTLCVGNKAVTFNLDQTSRYSSNYDDISVDRIDVIDVAYEEKFLDFLGNLSLLVVGKSSGSRNSSLAVGMP
nr:reverse transcriptase domain-containing protein [Tanacetum cinerariifolium]